MTRTSYSEVILKKVLDADFHTVMKSVEFSTTPREVVTVGNMMDYYDSMEREGYPIYEER